MRIPSIALAAVCVLVAGCGQSQEQQAQQAAQQATAAASQAAQQAGQAAQQGSQALAQGLTQMAQALKAQTGPDGKPITAVDAGQLTALLPAAPAGWSRGKVESHQMAAPIAVSVAEADYTKGPAHAHAIITDSALNPAFLAPYSVLLSMNYSEKSPNGGYRKSTTYGTQPGVETWDGDTKHGEITMIVNKRFVVYVTGDGLDNMDSLKAVSGTVNLTKLSSLQ